MNPVILFKKAEAFSFSLNLSAKYDENTANIIHHIVPVVINVSPSSKKGNMPYVLLGLINCGKNARKKRATLGFSTLVITPCKKNLLELYFLSLSLLTSIEDFVINDRAPR